MTHALFFLRILKVPESVRRFGRQYPTPHHAGTVPRSLYLSILVFHCSRPSGHGSLPPDSRYGGVLDHHSVGEQCHRCPGGPVGRSRGGGLRAVSGLRWCTVQSQACTLPHRPLPDSPGTASRPAGSTRGKCRVQVHQAYLSCRSFPAPFLGRGLLIYTNTVPPLHVLQSPQSSVL